MSEENGTQNITEEVKSDDLAETSKTTDCDKDKCEINEDESDGEINDESDGEINDRSDGEIDEKSDGEINDDTSSSKKEKRWENLENLELDFESDVNIKEVNAQNSKINLPTKDDDNTEKDKDEGEISEDDNEAGELEEGELKDSDPFPNKQISVPNRQINHIAPPPSNTPICRFFLRGSCFFGADCKYLHMNNNSYHMFPPNSNWHPGLPPRNGPMFMRENQRPFEERKNYNRRDNYIPPNYDDNAADNCKENNFYERERNQYSEKPYNDRPGWKRNYNNGPENDYNNKEYTVPPYRERGKQRTFEREILPNGREMERSTSPRSPRRSESSRSNSYSDLSSDSESSFRSSYSRSSYQSSYTSRSPSPTERISPTKSVSSRKSENSASGRRKTDERSNLTAALYSSNSRDNIPPHSLISSIKETAQRSYSPHSGTKRPLSPEPDVAVKRHLSDNNSESTSKSRREHLLQQLRVVEDAIARKRSTKVR